MVVEDVINFSKAYVERYGDDSTPVFLMGHSMGGLISSFVEAK